MVDNSEQLDTLYLFLYGRKKDAGSENAALLDSVRHKAVHSIEVKQAFFAKHAQQLVDDARAVAAVYRSGHRMLASGLVDHRLVVETDSIHRVQEMHVACCHILWDLAHTPLADHRYSNGAAS